MCVLISRRVLLITLFSCGPDFGGDPSFFSRPCEGRLHMLSVPLLDAVLGIGETSAAPRRVSDRLRAY